MVPAEDQNKRTLLELRRGLKDKLLKEKAGSKAKVAGACFWALLLGNQSVAARKRNVGVGEPPASTRC